MKVLIIEDELKARRSIKRMLGNFAPLTWGIHEAENVEQGIQQIKEIEPELVFMDIELPDGTCFDLLHQLSPVNFKIIFTTGYSKYIKKAFEFSDLPYLEKPILQQQLEDAVEKYLHRRHNLNKLLETLLHNQANTPERISFSTSQGTETILMQDIICCEADSQYTRFLLQHQEVKVASKTLKIYDEYLQEHGFSRVHASFLVNDKFVEAYRKNKLKLKYKVKLKNGELTNYIPVSRQRRKQFLQSLFKF